MTSGSRTHNVLHFKRNTATRILATKRDKSSPKAILSAGQLCQNTRPEQGIVILTLDDHTGTDIQLLQPRCGVKGNVVARYKAPPLFFKANFVL